MYKILIIIAIVTIGISTGCTETNSETLIKFNNGNQINCKTGLFDSTHNVITNKNFTYNDELMLFIGTTSSKSFSMRSCYSRH